MKTALRVTLDMEYDHCEPGDMLDVATLIVDAVAFLHSTCGLSIATDDYGIAAKPERIDITISRANPDFTETRLAERTFVNKEEVWYLDLQMTSAEAAEK